MIVSGRYYFYCNKMHPKIYSLANNFIRNNVTRSLNIFGIKKIDVSYCLLSNVSALLSKSYFQSETYSFVHKKLNI